MSNGVPRRAAIALALCGFGLMPLAWAADAPVPSVPDAAASDPAGLGWMKGAPPPPERTVRFDDGSYWQFPALRWSVSHFRELMPTVNVSRGLGTPVPLPRALRTDIDALQFLPIGATQPMTLGAIPGGQLHRWHRGAAARAHRL